MTRLSKVGLEHRNTSVECLLSPSEVADLLGVSTKTVHRLVRERKMACVQVTARDRRFTHEQVQQYIRSQSTEVRVDKKAPRPYHPLPRKGVKDRLGFLERISGGRCVHGNEKRQEFLSPNSTLRR
jgi:excisionase family DNA binding protein